MLQILLAYAFKDGIDDDLIGRQVLAVSKQKASRENCSLGRLGKKPAPGCQPDWDALIHPVGIDDGDAGSSNFGYRLDHSRSP